MRKLLPAFSYANVVASLALFIALSSGAYAAAVLPRNSVGANQIAPNAVGGSELKDDAVGSDVVKNGSLKEQDLSPTTRKALAGVTGPSGAAGSAGAAGPSGTQGPAGATGTQGLAGSVGANGLPGATGATGIAGVPGATGPAGSPGTASAWAQVAANGTVGTNLKVGNATEKTPAAGVSCLDVLTPQRPSVVVGMLDNSAADSRDTIAATVDPTTVAAACNSGADVVVTTWSFTQGAPVDEGYYVMFN